MNPKIPPTFLYPKSRQFPFDDACRRVVLALEARAWDVPGVTVELDTYGSGHALYRMVREVVAGDVRLYFGRAQARLGTYNDTAAVRNILIHRKHLAVYEDESGPSLTIYVGDNYETDVASFKYGGGVNSKLNKEPRRYLKYKGSWGGRYYYQNRRPPLLVHDNDLGREYDPVGDEPTRFTTNEVFAEFQKQVENVLAQILEHPTKPMPEVVAPTTTPWPAIGTLFCHGNWRDADRIVTGRTAPEDLDPAHRYGFSYGGYKLTAFAHGSDRDMPVGANEHARWCGLGPVPEDGEYDDFVVPGRDSYDEYFVMRITPNRADGIYIADNAVYERVRKDVCARARRERPGQDRLTDAEVNEFIYARARTCIPVTEYKGDFEQPLVLVTRELDLDEVEVVIDDSNSTCEERYRRRATKEFVKLNGRGRRREARKMRWITWQEFLKRERAEQAKVEARRLVPGSRSAARRRAE